MFCLPFDISRSLSFSFAFPSRRGFEALRPAKDALFTHFIAIDLILIAVLLPIPSVPFTITEQVCDREGDPAPERQTSGLASYKYKIEFREGAPHGSSLESETLPLARQPPLALAHPHQQQLHYQTFQDIPAPSVDGPSDEEDEFSETSDWSMVVQVLFGLAAGMIVIWLMVQMVLFAIAWYA
ncbi:uncharacterized protein PG986_000899 [Apiospora aurea]|uniref:Uncharacterized protein n=1 Tax=Apiospora aurea TaxID=335848 RepID=A0ABR1QVA2_9PEZI